MYIHPVSSLTCDRGQYSIIHMWKRVNIAGSGLLSLENPACKVGQEPRILNK